ncbi:MAG: indolepyruvate ferredoxin oxidoreductase subunit alpha [Acidilobaceae archaeon]|nr:indolepyruvate ferredoxin oxidoreductase subunit alpha [Acidilobaceae archaeon]MDW7974319.1 indolepyruvate ferredoxin oxidoreductase subunit alpha [Sulfolobales archaeon]
MSYPEMLSPAGSRVFTLGNVAIARASLEYGVGVAAGYPGTPSSEIIEALGYAARKLGYPYVEWSVNEKVAFEVAYGAAMAGVPSIVTMKHVGLNVAADPLFSSAYTGVESSLLVVSADDPSMWSSQNEQDNRIYGLHAYVPVFEPAGAQEVREATLEALRFSEEHKHPVILRTVTRVSHTRALYTFGELRGPRMEGRFQRDPSRWALVPAHARRRREELVKKWELFSHHLSSSALNAAEGPEGSELLVVGAGIGFRYAREALSRLGLLGKVRLLKLTTTVPLPRELIASELERKEKVFVVEEGEPVVEDQLKLLSFDLGMRPLIMGKRSGHVKLTGELRLDAVAEGIASALGLSSLPREVRKPSLSPPPRPPTLCPGCPYRGVFYSLRKVASKMKLKLIYSGDIGCYSLGINPPLSSQDIIVEMGGSLGVGAGLTRAVKDAVVVATIGDSTFYHAGMPGLVNAAFNGAPMLVLVLDNGTTAMTGHQPNPATGHNLRGEARRIPIEEIARAAGASSVRVVNSFEMEELDKVVAEALTDARGGKLSVLVARGACILEAVAEARESKIQRPLYYVEQDRCRACTICYNLFACPAILSSQDGKAKIDPSLCTGCGVCVDVCPFDAILPRGEVEESWRRLLSGG